MVDAGWIYSIPVGAQAQLHSIGAGVGVRVRARVHTHIRARARTHTHTHRACVELYMWHVHSTGPRLTLSSSRMQNRVMSRLPTPYAHASRLSVRIWLGVMMTCRGGGEGVHDYMHACMMHVCVHVHVALHVVMHGHTHTTICTLAQYITGCSQ